MGKHDTRNHLVSVRLSALVAEYLADCGARGLSPKTLHTYRYSLVDVFLPWCEGAGVEETSEVDQGLLNALSTSLLGTAGRKKGSQLSKATVLGYLAPVKHFLDWARAEGVEVEGRPHLPRQPKRKLQVLSREEIQRMEDAARSERDRLIVRLLADTGMRVGELCRLRTSDLVQRDQHWYLLVRGKGSRERWVPLPRWHRRLVAYATRGRPENVADDSLFLTLRTMGSGLYEGVGWSGVEAMIRWLARAAGIERRVYPHLFRHSAITYLLGKRLNEFQVKTIVGNFSHLENYDHLGAEDGRDALLAALAGD